MSSIKIPQAQNEADFQVETQVETQAVSTVVINMPPEESFKVYKYRFVVLAVYSLLAAVFGIEISVEGPLITVLQNIYDQDIFIVTLSVSLIEFIVYVPAGFVANYVLDKYGLKIGVSVGCFFLAVGMWINVFCEHSFWFIFAGSFVAAMGQPFVFNAPQMVSSNWFPPKERALSTAIASMSNPVGAAIGYLISGAFVSNDASGETGLKQFHNLMLFGAILGSSTVALNLIFFKAQPPSPPSKSAELHKLTTCQSLKSLSGNWSYIVFAISASLTWGSVSFFGAMVQPMVYPFGYTITQAGIIATITLACGLVGSLVWAAYVDKTKKFKRSVIICSILTIGFTVFLGAGLFLKQFAITAVATGCMGFFAMPLLSLGFEICAELSFPVAEGTAGGLFVLTSNLVSVFGTLAADAILEGETKAETMYVLAIIIGLQVIALIGFIFFKEDLRRLKADKKANAESNNTSNEENKSDEEIKKLSELLSSSHHVFNKEEVTPTILRSIVSCHL